MSGKEERRMRVTKWGFVRQKLNRFWSDESGQTTTEYMLILAVVFAIAMKFKSTIVNQIQGRMDRMGGQMDQLLDEG